MAATFAPVPRLLFTVGEPLSLFAAAAAAFLSPASFVADQLPGTPPHALTPSQLIVALQLGNLYLLIGLIGVAVLYTTTSSRVVRCYIFAFLLGDIGHLAVTYHGMGGDKFCDIATWNSMAWGNIGVTSFIFLARCAYLLGLLGKDRELAKPKAI